MTSRLTTSPHFHQFHHFHEFHAATPRGEEHPVLAVQEQRLWRYLEGLPGREGQVDVPLGQREMAGIREKNVVMTSVYDQQEQEQLMGLRGIL